MHGWIEGMGKTPGPQSGEAQEHDRRLRTRHDFSGEDVRALVGNLSFTLRLKDLSCTGLCGLTDVPLARGERIILLSDAWDGMVAEICWTRNVWLGANFLEPLELETVRKLRARYRGKRRRRNDRAGAAS